MTKDIPVTDGITFAADAVHRRMDLCKQNLMYTPASTYRLQVNNNFKLQQIKDIAEYLHALGITTIYCSPLFQAKTESNHGYDVVDPNVVNTEVGTVEELQQLSDLLHKLNIGWIQDIVPNHMAYHHSNVWLKDIFEKGEQSDHATFFDIDWNHDNEQLKGKVMMPFLEDELEIFIHKKDVQLQFNPQGFFIRYHQNFYPLSWKSYYTVLSYDAAGYLNDEYMQLLEEFKTINHSFSDSSVSVRMPACKDRLYGLYASDANVRSKIDALVETINNDPKAMLALLDQQYFALTPYRLSDHQINYRRFFIVNELISLKMERPEVFHAYHQFLKTLIDQNLIQGLRVDHVDGLYDPGGYMDSLRKLVGAEVYIVIEKILERKETLCSHWPIQGTSGYEFLSLANHLFTHALHEKRLTEIYEEFIGSVSDYDALAFAKKTLILTKRMNGELDNLIKLLPQIEPAFSKDKMKEALAVLLASFTVYRTYVISLPMREEDRSMIEEAFEKAETRRPHLAKEFSFLRAELLIDADDPEKNRKLKGLTRMQQFTAPLAAKGIEDTLFYVYNRLISHNEVGDCPTHFGISVQEFHENMKQRLMKLPLSINATTTHDTKRGEDARMRINALSEMPEEWSAAVTQWKHNNSIFKTNNMPSLDDEYFIYQSLIGSFPANEIMDAGFIQRLKDFVIKAIREARTYTDWSNPNIVYEQSTLSFVVLILKDEDFMNSFLPFLHLVKQHGMLLSLGQTLIKITAPGIPDTFQGAELWDLNFVDPDNRRVVDFDLRKHYLSDLTTNYPNGKISYLKELMNHAEDGRIKLFTTWAALNERKEKPALFQNGDYISLTFEGSKSQCLIGYARRLGDQWSVAIAPKEVSSIGEANEFPLANIWEDTVVLLPADAPDTWENIFTGEYYHATSGVVMGEKSSVSDTAVETSDEDRVSKTIALNKILENFPVALLRNH